MDYIEHAKALYISQCWQSFGKIPIGDIKWCSHATATDTQPGNSRSTLLACAFFLALYRSLTCLFAKFCFHFWSVCLLFSMVYWFANKLHRIAFFNAIRSICRRTHSHTHSNKIWTQALSFIFTTANYIVAAILIWPFIVRLYEQNLSISNLSSNLMDLP